MTTYTVVKGDTCPSVAMKVYGDARRIDLLHQANSLGPPPHNLKEGQILNILPLSGAPTGPDATVGAVRNRVDVFAPAQRPAKVHDALSRGNRVSTEESSAATIDFRDETRMYLGENTLVVILGDTSRAASRRSTAPEASLVNGSLRTRLSELSGKAPAPLKVTTDSATVAAGKGETQVSVDPSKTTRLAVYNGQSSITAQKKQVDVSQGFGSKAEQGKAPTPPKPLPASPEWKEAPSGIAFVGAERSISALYANGTGQGKPASKWHVQLAKDADFQDIVVDTKVAAEVTKLEARGLENVVYFARVSAIDDDQFEGPWGQTLSFTVVSLSTSTGDNKHKTRLSFSSTLVTCSLDGSALNADQAIEIDTLTAHVMRCEAKSNSSLAVEKKFPSTSRGALSSIVEPARRVSDYEVLVRYQMLAEGKPIETGAYRALPPKEDGVSLLSDAVDPSDAMFRVARVRVRSTNPFRLPLVVDEVESTLGDVNEIPRDVIPAAKSDKRARTNEVDALLLAGVDIPTSGGGAGPTLGLEATYVGYVAPTTALGVGVRALAAAERIAGKTPERRFGYAVGVPITLRIAPVGSIVQPYVGAQPSYMLVEGARASAERGAVETSQKGFGLSWLGGATLELGRARVIGELGYRRMLTPALRASGGLDTTIGVGVSFLER
ncbi:MAG: FecR domain-containing protein [Polyangiaceae bacterium]